MGEIITTPLYWDCQCLNHFIHPATQTYCTVCGAEKDQSSDSVVKDVEQWLFDQLCALNSKYAVPQPIETAPISTNDTDTILVHCDEFGWVECHNRNGCFECIDGVDVDKPNFWLPTNTHFNHEIVR